VYVRVARVDDDVVVVVAISGWRRWELLLRSSYESSLSVATMLCSGGAVTRSATVMVGWTRLSPSSCSTAV